MATFLDVSLIKSFDVIFPVILVWAVSFSALQYLKPLGNSVGLNAIISGVVGLMILLSDKAVQMINFMTPWFAVAIIFFLLLFLIFRMFGAKDETFTAVLKQKEVYWFVIGVGVVIFGAGIADTFGQDLTSQAFTGDGTNPQALNQSLGGSSATADFDQNIAAIIFSPKVLGLMIIFLIMASAIALLTSS